MKKLIIVVGIACASGLAAYGQSLEDIVALGDKQACSMADLAAMAPALVDSFPENQELAARLEQALGRYPAESKLTKARASWVAANAIGVDTSLMFLFLKTERHAFRAMVVDGVFSASSSGGDTMSGVDLLDFVATLGDRYGVAP